LKRILFKTEKIKCNDWTHRHLGNQAETKNEDSYLKHNLYRLIIDIEVKLYISFNGRKFYKIESGYKIENIDNNTLLIKTSHEGLYIKRNGILNNISSEEGYYKIIIRGE
jgi:hypothetical protein